MPNLFSVPIFFIVFRETVEAAIIVSALHGLAKHIVEKGGNTIPTSIRTETEQESNVISPENDALLRRRLLRKMKIQIYLGVLAGFIVALTIGAAFIVVWFKEASNLWSKSEELWEGVFQLVAAVMIFIIGISMLKLDQAKVKWRIKLERAFTGKGRKGSTRTGKWILFILPFITVLREALEGVVFVSGVALGQPGSAVPIAALTGIFSGFVLGVLMYQFGSRTTLSIFLIVMTNLLLLVGAGLFTKAVAAFERRRFNLLLGADVDDAKGDGPGSYDVRGNVWHLACCRPENNADGQGWGVFWSIFGWSNNADIGSILAYVFYWVAVILALIVMKFLEGRTKIFGFESAAGKKRRLRHESKTLAKSEKVGDADGPQHTEQA